jgi:hypothetical protein
MCTKCVLTSTTPGITFDESGVCNYCATYTPMKVAGEEPLREVLSRFKGKGARYDCMICVSGGRDSTYALWKCVNDYGMKVIAVNYKNPFTSAEARENMRRAVEQLKVDFYDWEFPNDAHRKATAKALRAWSHHPSSSLIPIVCGHCKTMWPTLFKIARQNRTPLIVVGTNPLETASFKKAGLGGARYYHKVSNLPKVVGKSARELAKNPRYLTHCSWSTVFKMYLFAGHNSPYLRWRYKDITVVRLFDYLKWSEKEVVSTITNNLGWQKTTEVESSWRFDCRLDYARRLMYGATVGVTELRDLFSKMIREGMLTRPEALTRLETEDVVPESVADSVLSELGMKLADLNLNRPGIAGDSNS